MIKQGDITKGIGGTLQTDKCGVCDADSTSAWGRLGDRASRNVEGCVSLDCPRHITNDRGRYGTPGAVRLRGM
ncbi:hypothetical protein StoSoilB22_21480 [Arthrobacter sp. StoSoilB22]|nr:hypothetical protein StoSoilB22_21480 [Arthrobacter sp. StoSoilB22]